MPSSVLPQIINNDGDAKRFNSKEEKKEKNEKNDNTTKKRKKIHRMTKERFNRVFLVTLSPFWDTHIYIYIYITHTHTHS